MSVPHCPFPFPPCTRQSFENLEHWRTDFLHNAAPPNPDAFPFILLGNKCDLEAERKVPKQKALQWAKSKGPNVSGEEKRSDK